MDKRIAIKELFKIQNNTEKLRIIDEYNLRFTGFTKINRNSLQLNLKKFENEVVNKKNIDNIQNNIINIKRTKDIKMDYLLSPEKIIEKYEYEFDYLIQVFELDKYNATTEKIIDQIKEINGNVNSVSLIEKNEEENNVDNLREIIIEQEDKISNREKKIMSLNNQIQNLRNDNLELIKKNKEIINENKLYKQNINKLEMELINIRIELENEISKTENLTKLQQEILIKNSKLEILNTKFNDLKQKYNEKLNSYKILGVNDLFKNQYRGINIEYFNSDEYEKFINIINNKKENEIYIAYELGISMKVIRKLKKIEQINVINDIYKIEKMIEENING